MLRVLPMVTEPVWVWDGIWSHVFLAFRSTFLISPMTQRLPILSLKLNWILSLIIYVWQGLSLTCNMGLLLCGSNGSRTDIFSLFWPYPFPREILILPGGEAGIRGHWVYDMIKYKCATTMYYHYLNKKGSTEIKFYLIAPYILVWGMWFSGSI